MVPINSGVRLTCWNVRVLLLLIGLAGCGSGTTGPQLYPLSGMVVLDGEPIPFATVLLQDPARQEKTYIATVENGVLSGSATPGQKIVQITAVRKTPGKMVPTADGSGMEEGTEQYLPERYNMQSTLTAEILPGPNNDLFFELSSK